MIVFECKVVMTLFFLYLRLSTSKFCSKDLYFYLSLLHSILWSNFHECFLLVKLKQKMPTRGYSHPQQYLCKIICHAGKLFSFACRLFFKIFSCWEKKQLRNCPIPIFMKGGNLYRTFSTQCCSWTLYNLLRAFYLRPSLSTENK